MSNYKLIEQAIKDHTFDKFPRQIGFPRQRMCSNIDYLIERYWAWNGSVKGVYTAVFPEHVKEFSLYNKFYFDIDKENDLKGATTDSAKLTEFLRRNFEVEPRRDFSGGKGFATYLYINPFEFKDYPIVHLRLAQLIREKTKITSLDSSVLGDTSRISRLPFVIHHKTEFLSFPTNPDWIFDEILENIVKYQGDFKVHVNVAPAESEGMDKLREFDDTAKDYRKNIKAKVATKVTGSSIPLDIILKRARNLNGYMRVIRYRVIIPALLATGSSAEEIHGFNCLFSELAGVKYDYQTQKFVERYIQYYAGRDWKPLSANSLFVEYPELLKRLYP